MLTGAVARILGTELGAVSDVQGALTIADIPSGTQTIVLSYAGYKGTERTLVFPIADTTAVVILLSSGAQGLGEIVVEGTRSNRSIANTPTRVEVLTEEIDEASTMDPSKVAHLLTHSTGIQVQQTSATSNTANVRIQGLDGRYTQILKDGFPLYGGFSGSLSIMQIPPLDLRQVEYIKGSASTLYGGGAIAGLINLISKEPNGRETLIHLNASQIGALDVNTFVSRRLGKLGFTLLAQRNSHKAFDADGDGYTDMPELTKYNFNPKLFYYFSKRTSSSLGLTFADEIRKGGDLRLIEGEAIDTAHFYREQNKVQRTTTQLRFDHETASGLLLTLRHSFNFFDRQLEILPAPNAPDYSFQGRQLSSFSELSVTHRREKNVLITGVNLYTDAFKETGFSPVRRDEGYQTIGAFGNYTFDVGRMLSFEAGLRTDYVRGEKLFILPRLSALFKWTNKLATRIGAGMGYRNPTIFNQEAEIIGYQDVRPINKERVKAEESFGGNADIGYKTTLGGRWWLNVNQMFFYTRVDKPLVLNNAILGFGLPEFVNADGYTRSYGGETFFKLGFYDFVLFVGYTYTNAVNNFGNSPKPVTLTPQHSLKGDLLYALPGKWRIGLDYEFKSSQTLSSNYQTPSYWTYGAVVEYTRKWLTLFGNLENFTNVRQTKYGSLRSRPYGTPQFTEVWAPLDGIVFNYGLKLRL